MTDATVTAVTRLARILRSYKAESLRPRLLPKRDMMKTTNGFRSPLEIFETIHREMLTLIAHCTFHRSLLQDMILRHADNTPDTEEHAQVDTGYDPYDHRSADHTARRSTGA